MNSLERDRNQNHPATPGVRPPHGGGEAQHPPKHPSLGGLGWIVLILIVVGVVAGAVPRLRASRALVGETALLSLPTVTTVRPAPSQQGAGVALPAEIRAQQEAPIFARASGYLKRWLVDLGAEVQAGQLLAEIDIPDLRQELAQARAQLLQAEAALALAKTTAIRWAELLKSASVSEQEAAEKEADFALKTATVEAARANARKLQELESFAQVTAPFAGTITARRTEVGELVSAGQGRELFHLAQTKTLRVFVRVPQSLAKSVRIGETAEILIPELPKRSFTGKIVRTAGSIAADSRTLLVELELDNASGEVLSGSFAQVRLPHGAGEPVLSVPSNALIFRAEGTQLAVVRDGKVELRPVTVGRDFGATMEILSGAATNDVVVLNPPDSLVHGMAVNTHTAAPLPAPAPTGHK